MFLAGCECGFLPGEFFTHLARGAFDLFKPVPCCPERLVEAGILDLTRRMVRMVR